MTPGDIGKRSLRELIDDTLRAENSPPWFWFMVGYVATGGGSTEEAWGEYRRALWGACGEEDEAVALARALDILRAWREKLEKQSR